MKKKKDLTNGDHSFKNWFRIMERNGYVTIFVIMLAATIAFGFFPRILDIEPDSTWRWILLAFFGGITLLISYKGFYQKWKDLKNGRSR